MISSTHDEIANGVGHDTELRVQAGHERVVVRKSETDRLAARVSLRTHEMDVPVAEQLRTETASVERVPVDRIVAEAPASRVEDGVTIIPVVEEVLVVQYRIVEEVRITTRSETVEHRETVTLRRQDVVIDEMPGTDS